MTHNFAHHSYVLKSPKDSNYHTKRTSNNRHAPLSLRYTEKRRQNNKIVVTESESASQQNATKIEIFKSESKHSKRSYTRKNTHVRIQINHVQQGCKAKQQSATPEQ